MGVVLDATHVSLGARVCVKVLRPEATAQPDLIDRFRLEAQALAKLGGGTHPNLVHVRDFGSAGGRWYLVMERLEGVTFEDERRRRGAVPWREAAGYISQALAGLAIAHHAGILHRDVKPANLFLCDAVGGEPRRVKVLDFGIAKLAELAAIASEVARPANPTEAGVTLGTLRYMSPEQLAGGNIDARTDVYAMGLVLWALITGKLPHAEARGEDLVRAQVKDQLPPPSTWALVPPALDALIARAIAKRRDERPRDAGAFRDELDAILRQPEPTDAVARPSVPQPATPQPPTPLPTTPLPRPAPRRPEDPTERLPAKFLSPARTVRLEPPVPIEMPVSEAPEASTARMVRQSAPAEPLAARPPRRPWLFVAAMIAATLLFTALGGAVLGWCSP